MQGARSFIMCLQIYRYINSSSVCSSISREGKFMKKIMNGGRKSKRKWYDINFCNTGSINPIDKPLSIHTSRRMMIRDKLFMQHITDMMSMGEVSDIIKGNIEITHVKITPDFKYINVFYIPNNDNASFDQEALQKCTRIIRHELSQLRVIGVVPPIQFVPNKKYSAQVEVERRLAMINFEEDSEILCSEQMQFDISDVNQISHKESVANRDTEADEFDMQLPMMRHDVLSLDHHKIMSQITTAVSKSKKAAQRRMLDINTVNNNVDESPCDPVSKKAVEFLTRKEQQKIFSDFLIQKRREELRRYNLERSNKEKMLNNFKEEIDDESDYEDDNIDEDFDDAYINDDIEDETRK